MKNRTKNVITAILLIILSVCLVMWKLNVLNLPLDFVAGVSTWGLIVAVIMVICIFYSVMDLNYGGIFFPLAVLCIIFDEPLGITAITPWIVLLVALLLTIALEKLIPSHYIKRHFRKTVKNKGQEFSEEFSEKFNDKFNEAWKSQKVFSGDGVASKSESKEDQGFIFHSMKMGSSTKYINSKNLREAVLSSEFGELSVFFDQAEVPDGKVKIDVHVAFGEMQLYIPKEWRISNLVSSSMGDVEEKGMAPSLPENPIDCEIVGSVSFGDLVITRI